MIRYLLVNFLKPLRALSETNITSNFTRVDPLNSIFPDHVEAIVDEPIQPCKAGRVHFRASWWLARCEQEVTLERGSVVCVIGRQGNTLLVVPTGSIVQLSDRQ